jgi:hypothetical protein
MEICTKEEFMQKFENDVTFLKLYKQWQDNNYQRGYAPSIDRIDNSLGYNINNLQFMQHSHNGRKDWMNPVKCLETGMIFESQVAAAKFYDVSPWLILKVLADDAAIPGVTLERINA